MCIAYINSKIKGGTGEITYRWFFPNETSLDSLQPTLSNVASGSYILEATDDNGCKRNFSYYLPRTGMYNS